MYGLGGERKLDEHDARPPRAATRARGRCGSATPPTSQDQHDVWGALLDSVYLHTRSRDSLDERVWPILQPPGRGGDRELAQARPRHLGGARRAQALHLLEDVLLGRVRPRRPAGRDARGLEQAQRWQDAADEIHADICEHGVDERGVFVQHYETNALDAALLLMPLMRFLPPDDPRDPRHRARDRRRADRERAGAALPDRGDRRRPHGREGTFLICSFWLVSALCRDRRARPRARAVRAAARLRQPARALRRGDRPAHRPPPRQLPAGVHAPGADQRGHARDPRRGTVARGRSRRNNGDEQATRGV